MIPLVRMNVAAVALFTTAPFGRADDTKTSLRVAIVGTDTSHCIAFTQLINAPQATGVLADIEVVTAFPGGSPDIPTSRDRVQVFSEQLRKSGVKIVDSIEAAAEQSDAVLLESVDGRAHLEQFRQLARGKPIFVDKPAASSVAEFLQMMEIAEETNTPFFSSSGLRFCAEVEKLKADASLGAVFGASTSTPYHTEPHHPDLFWYGIHGVEALSALMGHGCQEVRRQDFAGGVLMLGKWRDGRQGTVWALSTPNSVYSYAVYGDKKVGTATGFSGYANLVNQIGEFFVSRQAPIAPEVTLEILAMMQAADQSRDAGGAPISIADVIERAKQQQSNSK